MNKEEIKNKLCKLVFFIMAIILGVFGATMLNVLVGNLNHSNKLLVFILEITFLIIPFLLQVILHEVGHLICGFWSGYEFVFFRVGVLSFVKKDDKIVIKKYITKGIVEKRIKCVMMPPKEHGYDFPYIFYNLGGILLNAIVSGLCVAIYIMYPISPAIAPFLISMVYLGIFILLISGIPMKLRGIANDAYNVIDLAKYKTVRYSFYSKLRVHGLLQQGVCIKDIPLSLFEIPSGVDLNNNIIIGLKIYEAYFYHDRKEFEKAKEILQKLLNDAPRLKLTDFGDLLEQYIQKSAFESEREIIEIVNTYGSGIRINKINRNNESDSNNIIISKIFSLIVLWGIVLIICRNLGIPIIAIIFFILAEKLQVVLHEAGHLICGFWSGYRFVLVTVGQLTFVKEEGKIVVKKYKFNGVGGLCQMIRSEGTEYDCPYILYYLGGIIMNAIISVLCFVLYMFFHTNEIISIFLIMTAISGVLNLIMNGIPMKFGGIANDGYKVIALTKDKNVRYSFYTILKLNRLIYQGVRIKDIPLTLFKLSSDADLNKPMISSLRMLEADYYQDRKEFGKSREVLEKLLNDAPKLHKRYKNAIKCNILFYEIIGEGREEVINGLYTKELKKYIKSTNCYLSIQRLRYAYALIIDKDLNKANKILTEFEKLAKNYPSKSEIESEREIIEIIKIIGAK